VQLEIPDEISQFTGLTNDDLRLRLAIQLFEEEKITLGLASQLAGIHQVEFQRELAKRNIPIHYDVQDFEKDLVTISEMKLK
jgi:predicted HTH domain antitoxin